MVVWESQVVGNCIETCLSSFKQRERDVFTQIWQSKLDNSTRARCYITLASSESKVFGCIKYCKISEKFKSFMSVVAQI